jgi:uncharacterized membrane protein
MAARKPGTAARPGSTKSRDKGTRGGRPVGPAATGQRQGSRPGNGRPGNGRPAPARAVATARAVAVPDDAATGGPPPWLGWTTWVLSLAGLGVSVYLTIAHFNTTVSLACPATSTINCEKVTTSAQSYVFGIPVAVLGLAFYLFLAAANAPWAWRWAWPPLRWARAGSLVVGMLFVLYLVYTELFTIGAICLWCTSVHVVTFALFVLIMFSFAAGYGTTKAHARA